MFKNENIVCFAGEDWWYHNPHSNLHIMQSFSRDNKVLFVNSIGIRMPDLKKDKFAGKRILKKMRSMLKFFKKAQPNIYVLTPFALPMIESRREMIYKLNTSLLISQISLIMFFLNFKNPLIWVSIPSVRDVVLHFQKNGAKKVIYYSVDNISYYKGANQKFIDDLDRDLQQKADVAFFVNRDLLNERKSLNSRTYHVGHGVDYDHFATAQESLETPEDIRNIPQPIVGYMGMIRGVDFKLIEYLAKKNTDKSFVFIGEVMSDADAVKDLPNVHFLGKKPYAELPKYIRTFSCCSLYYKTDNEFDNYRNPKKLVEYLATGKPVVALANTEIRKFQDLIEVAEDYESFDRKLNAVIAKDPQENRVKRMQYARQNTWDDVAGQISSQVMGLTHDRLPRQEIDNEKH